MLALAAIGLAGTLGCGEEASDTSAVQGAALGDALGGTNSTDFATAKANFGLTETANDGLGPVFNQQSCGQCHANGALGGAGQNIERRYGKFTNGVFDPMASTGGSLRQLFGIGGYQDHDGTNCNANADSDSFERSQGASVFAGRLTTPTFGLGLVELIPDQTIRNIAAAQAPGIRGTVATATIHITDPRGPSSLTRGSSHVARFGWKAAHASLTDFAADAYLNEMGITTTHCAAGAVVRDFATENRTDRAPVANNGVINGCDDDKVAGTDDDAAADDFNNCAGGVTNVQEDVSNFAFFMRNLAAPPRGIDNSGGRGQTVFTNIGCAGCHVTTTFTVTINGRSQSFQPFSDFLTHDMGGLGDGIGNGGEAQGSASLRLMRTAPLWGLHSRNLLLHDGRTSDRAAAIRAHGGQGAAAASAFNGLTAAQQGDLLNFLSSL